MSRRTPSSVLPCALLVLLTILACPAAAFATVSPTDDPEAIAREIMATPAQLTAASWRQRPINIAPSATATSFGAQPPASAFPSDGDGFAILSSGDVSWADTPNGAPDVSASGWGADRHDSHDVSVLRLDVNVPAKANCLSLDFSFLSEEYPDYLGDYNDAFVAELDTSDWTASGTHVSAPHNFAFDERGDVVSINAHGIAAVTAADATGTTYNGATARISAATPIAPGPHRIYLSISDNGDWALDSAAFVDNLQIGKVSNPSANCQAGVRPQPPRFQQPGPRSATGREGSVLTTDGEFSDLDAPLILAISQNPGRFVAHGDGSWTWSLPAPDDVRLSGITVIATTGLGFADSESFDAIATNVAPTVTLAADNDTTVPEGPGEHVVAYSISDPGADTVESVVTSCGPGTKVPGSDEHTDASGSFRCMFADGPAAALVTVQATDDDGGESELASQLFTVHNVAPTVAFDAAASTFDERAASRTFDVAISDPGRDTISASIWDCGDGGRKVAGSSRHSSSSASFACVFADGPAVPTVTAAAEDSDGGRGTAAALAVSVRDVGPTLVLDETNPSSVDEGRGEVAFRYWTADPGDDTVAVTASCGEHGDKVAGSDDAGRFACVFADGDAASQVSAAPVDSDGLAGRVEVREVSIHNVSPRVTLRGDDERSVDEGAAERSFHYSIDDPGQDDVTAASSCGDGGKKLAASDVATQTAGSFRCVFADGPAQPRVTVAATDSDGATGAGARDVTVRDVAPTVTLAADNPRAVPESHDKRRYRYAISDPGDDTIASVQTSCGEAGAKLPGSEGHAGTSGEVRCVFASGPARSEVSVRATDSDGLMGAADAQAVAVADPAISAAATDVAGVETAVISRRVARFTDPTPYATAQEYAASIDWGDGSAQSAGTIRSLGDGTFAVEAGHAYSRFGTYAVAVRIADADNPANHAVARATARIADAPIHAAGAPITTPQTYVGRVATFTDVADPDGPATDFSAKIDWGDGSPRTPATISGPDLGGHFGVSGTHAYGATGRYSVRAVVTSVGGSTDATTSSALVYAFASATGASFAIGDRRAAEGAAVTFWSNQWQKDNPFISNAALGGAFKGFVDPPPSMTPPRCGDTWTGRAGGSSSPPSSVPSYMAVVVSSAIERVGSAFSGDVQRIAIVRTDAGYATRAGTGVVVGTVCG